MRPNERQQHILELLRQRERISVEELARTLGTSQETIRRDLTTLSEGGQVTKYHGGASLPPRGEHENAFQTRMNEFSIEKRAVARYAAGLYSPGDSILIDTGTTTLFFARELAKLSRITVITIHGPLSIPATLRRECETPMEPSRSCSIEHVRSPR